LKVEFSSNKPFSNHFIKVKADKSETEAYYTLPFGWTTVQNNLPLIQFDIDYVLDCSEKEIILQNMKEHPQVDPLKTKYFEQSGHFRGRNF
jgi:hypothetical protein